MLAMVVLIVHVNEAERRIPVQYAKRQVGRKMYGGQASTLPMKVNMSGVLPIIFAQTIASLPATIWAFVGTPEEGTVGRSIYNAIDTKSVLYLIVYFLMIIGFSYFYATIQFNPVEISNNLKRNGGFIPGFRPGKPTSDFIAKVLNKVTLFRCHLPRHRGDLPADRRQAAGQLQPRHRRYLGHHRCRCCT